MGFSLIDKLYANRNHEETVQVLGRNVKFRVLGAAEEDDVLKSAASNNYFELIQARRIPTLSRAIVSIDNVEWRDFDEIKQRLRSNPQLEQVQAIEQELRQPVYTEDVIAAFFNAYSEFRGKYREELDALKKTSIPQSPVIAG